jgi:ABC-type branched-subunit amino acid transport system ATPase component
VRRRAGALAHEVGLQASGGDRPIAALDASARVRLRLGRALALDPAVLLLEHVSAGLSAPDSATLGADIRRIAAARGAAIVAATLDDAFARAVAGRVLQWQPATGRFTEQRSGRWFGRLLG